LLTYGCEVNGSAQADVSHSRTRTEVEATLETLRARDCRIRTSSKQFNEWLARSSSDLHMMFTATPFGFYPYAGVPWFSTPFGRDGITALEYLWVNPEIARGVLGYLAAFQAKQRDPARDAEPGKILHETRKGEMAALREIPILSGLFDASLFVEYRLPELFCGFYRREGEGPVPHPVACSPQSWAAASVFILLQAILGMRVDAVTSRLSFTRPVLPDFLDEIWIENLKVSSGFVDLLIHRRARYATVQIERLEGALGGFYRSLSASCRFKRARMTGSTILRQREL
jgi:glycogen debranching enzyme